ncbi:MAG: hypothetical protein D6714_13890 [Bacteroidetes bacterium]|nr:MAG: hypothetical protein D6714_13890 [Bacteroidota bacterium]
MNTIKKAVTLCLLCTVCTSLAQNHPCYFVEFWDKQNNHFELSNPSAFLSEKAIERRQRQGIPIAVSDLPVSPYYLDQLHQFDLQITHTSRWLNGAVVRCTEVVARQLRQLPFVRSVKFIGIKRGQEMSLPPPQRPGKSHKKGNENSPYGSAFHQIHMLNGDWLHNRGARGQDMVVAVLDGGFWMTDQLELLATARQSAFFRLSRDFTGTRNGVFESTAHGTRVLSIMAANQPGIMVGTAPAAQYVCLKTEDVGGEYQLDEYNWVVGLEYADSLGVDVVVSALGYTTFEDKDMNYDVEDLKNNAAISTQAANIAFQKGMIIVSSAGNEATNSWKYVSCPADGRQVLSVGAVDERGHRSGFSSLPATINGMVKPEIAALGESVTVAAVQGRYLTEKAHGTSYSAPIVGGLVAALWSAFPLAKNEQILEAVRASAQKDGQAGYGLPDFRRAYAYLSEKGLQFSQAKSSE